MDCIVHYCWKCNHTYFVSPHFYSEGYDDYSNSEDIEVRDDFPSDILNIPGRQFLYFSHETRIVYQMYEENEIEFLEPFISNNHLCMYIKGKVVEVVDDRIVAIVHTACLPK